MPNICLEVQLWVYLAFLPPLQVWPSDRAFQTRARSLNGLEPPVGNELLDTYSVKYEHFRIGCTTSNVLLHMRLEGEIYILPV